MFALSISPITTPITCKIRIIAMLGAVSISFLKNFIITYFTYTLRLLYLWDRNIQHVRDFTVLCNRIFVIKFQLQMLQCLCSDN